MNQVERRIVHSAPALASTTSCRASSARSASGSPRPERSTSRRTLASTAKLENKRCRHRTRYCEVRVVRHVDRLNTSQSRRPRSAVLPVERRLAGARANTHRQAARLETLRHPAAGLTRTAKNQRRLRLLRVIRLHRLLLLRGTPYPR